jgi:hypothetical protein
MGRIVRMWGFPVHGQLCAELERLGIRKSAFYHYNPNLINNSEENPIRVQWGGHKRISDHDSESIIVAIIISEIGDNGIKISNQLIKDSFQHNSNECTPIS